MTPRNKSTLPARQRKAVAHQDGARRSDGPKLDRFEATGPYWGVRAIGGAVQLLADGDVCAQFSAEAAERVSKMLAGAARVARRQRARVGEERGE
jgi:hypothetical protein